MKTMHSMGARLE